MIKCGFVLSAVTYPHFAVPTKEAALSKAPFINLEMNEMPLWALGVGEDNSRSEALTTT